MDSKEFGLKVDFKDLAAIQTWGGKIKRYIESQMEVKHPLEEGLKGIYGVIFSDEPKGEDATLRNVTIFADGQVDRSPCGTGTSARIATLLQKMPCKREKFSSTNVLLTGNSKGKYCR